MSEPSKLSKRLERTRQKIELLQAQRQLRMLESFERGQRLPVRLPKAQQNLQESSSEAWQWVSGYQDVIDRFNGTDRDFIFPFSTAMDRRYGENWPFWRTWQEHARLRAASRLIWTLSPLASGAISALTSYVVGEGMQTKIAGKDKDVAKELVAAVQAVVDSIIDRNDWMTMQQECFTRARRDGEFFLRDFPQDDGMTLFRIVDPEQIMEPPGMSREEASFGIITDPDDLLDIRGYWWAPRGVPSLGEYLPSSDVLHVKENVDGIIKRGLPDFAFDTQQLYKTVNRLLINMGQGASIQSAIAFVRQHKNVDTASIEAFVNAQGDYSETRPFTGVQQTIQRLEGGSVIDMDANQDFVKSPGADNVSGFTQVVQALLRAVATRWNAPEWIVSADASNNNMASSMVAESPFVKTCKRFQHRYARAFKHVIVHALRHYCRVRGGLRVGMSKYTWATLSQLIDVQVVPPTVETRNRQEEAMVNRTYVELGVKSRKTIATELGLDWDTEQQNNDEYDKAHPQGGQGGAGGNPLAAMMGGGGDQPPDSSPPDEPQPPDDGGDDNTNQPPQDDNEDFSDLEGFLDSIDLNESRRSTLNQFADTEIHSAMHTQILFDPAKTIFSEGEWVNSVLNQPAVTPLIESRQTSSLTELEAFASQLPVDERLSYIRQALLEGRGIDKLGRVICWDDKGKRIPCNQEKSETSERDRTSAKEKLQSILASPHTSTPKHAAEMVRLLKHLSTDEITALKKQYGLRTGGKKAGLAERLTQEARRILTQQQHYEREARSKGLPPAYVTGLAKQNYKLHAGYVKEARNLIWAARDYYESMTGKKLRIMRAAGRMDQSSIPELELIARGLKTQFPGILNPEADDTENASALWDLLVTGGPKMPDREGLYKQAIEQVEHEQKQADDAVPFDMEGLGDETSGSFDTGADGDDVGTDVATVEPSGVDDQSGASVDATGETGASGEDGKGSEEDEGEGSVVPTDTTPQPDGTRVSKSGVVFAKAKAGGEYSPVTGEFYKGGRWMPIHGNYVGQVKTKKDDAGTSTASPVVPDEDAEAKKKGSRQPREPKSPERIAQEKRDQDLWDDLKQTPIGELKWLGDSPNHKALSDSIIQLDKWKKFAESQGADKIGEIKSALEPQVLQQIRSEIETTHRHPLYRSNAEAMGLKPSTPDEDFNWEVGQLKQLAIDAEQSQPRKNKAHSNAVPDSFYVRTLVEKAIRQVESADDRILAMYDLGKQLQLFTGTDALGREWINGKLKPAQDDSHEQTPQGQEKIDAGDATGSTGKDTGEHGGASAQASTGEEAETEERVGGSDPDVMPGDFNPALHLNIAADSPERLRKADVFRVLEWAPPEHLAVMAEWLQGKRPDLKEEIDSALLDIEEERGSNPASPKTTSSPDVTTTPTNVSQSTEQPFIKRSKDSIRFASPIVGPSGAELLSYDWRFTEIEEPSGDEVVTRKISDWDQAEQNLHTGRNVVHQFHVKTADGKEHLVSLESALSLLGYGGGENPSSAKIRTLASNVKALARKRIELEISEKKHQAYLDAIAKADEQVKSIPQPSIEKTAMPSGAVMLRMGDAKVIDPSGKGTAPERINTLLSLWRDKRRAELLPDDVKGYDPVSGHNKIETLQKQIVSAEKKVNGTAESQSIDASASNPTPPEPGFSGKDDTGHCWQDGKMIPCPDESSSATLPTGTASEPSSTELTKSEIIRNNQNNIDNSSAGDTISGREEVKTQPPEEPKMSQANFQPIPHTKGQKGVLVIRGDTKAIKSELSAAKWKWQPDRKVWQLDMPTPYADKIREGGDVAKEWIKNLNGFKKGVLITLDGYVVFKSKEYTGDLAGIYPGNNGKDPTNTPRVDVEAILRPLGLKAIGSPQEFTKSLTGKDQGLSHIGREFSVDGKKYVTVEAGQPYYIGGEAAESSGQKPGWKQKHLSVEIQEFSPEKQRADKIAELKRKIKIYEVPSDDDRGEPQRLETLRQLNNELESLTQELTAGK